MKFFRHLLIFSLLAAPLAKADEKPGPVGADQGSSRDEKKREPMDARTLLEHGRASGSLPEGMVIRISACLGELEKTASADHLPAELRETWEFTSGQVRRVSSEDRTARPEDLRPFASKGICHDLLEGKAFEIQAGKGEGPEVGLIGSDYHRGARSIEVVWKGETVLHLFETNGPFLKFYPESDARAFGSLYERLASQARVLFKTAPAETK